MKQSKRWILMLLVLAGGLQASFTAHAQESECLLSTWTDFDYRSAFEGMASSPCFHVENNDSALGVEVNGLLNVVSSDPRGNALQALLALEAVQIHLGEAFRDNATPQRGNATALINAIAELKQSIEANPETPESELKTKWKLGKLDMLPEALAQLDFSTTLTDSECELVSSGKCDGEFAAAADIVRSIFLANAALDKYTQTYRADVLADRKLRRTKWDSYYDDLTFQYPWELWVNGLLLDATDDRDKNEGNLVGFRRLPKNKLVLFHPEANLVYADGADDEYDVSLTVEIVGYERFGFDSDGKVENPWGVSLLAAYLPHPERSESGWTGGLILKYDGYSLGITDNHGETGIVFNINLSQRIFDVKKDARQYYDDYENRLEAIKQRFQ